MSTDFRLSKRIQASDLLGGRLERFGVSQKMNDETSERAVCLTDGQNNCLWVYIDDEGLVSCLTRYMPNGNPNRILEAIAEAFDSDIFSEYEPQFWGFDTQEEWDAWHEDNRKDEDECYADLLRFLADQPNNIGAGTVREEQAQIAKRLVSEDSTLVSPNRRKEFIEEIRTAYDNSRKVVVCMEPKDDADLAAMTAAVEKHCPQGFTVIARRRR